MSFLFRRPKKAVILGCGPAGLFAAHALAQCGWSITIISKKRRSEMFGAQYLQAPIPGLPATHATVEFQLRGSWEGSTQKTYGAGVEPDGTWEEYVERRGVDAWDIRAAYYAAWDRYHEKIIPTDLVSGVQGRDAIDAIRYDADLTVSSVPLTTLCYDPRHIFRSHTIWTVGDAPERGIFCPIPCETNTVVVNGDIAPSWYRVSNLFGYKTAEWPEATQPIVENVVRASNPLYSNCTCYPMILRVGRFGTWNRAAFAHEAYSTAWGAVR